MFVFYRCAPPQSKSFSIKCGPNVHYKVTSPAGDRSAAPYPLTPNSVLIVTMDTVSETANDSKVPAVHPVTFVFEKIFTLKANAHDVVEPGTSLCRKLRFMCRRDLTSLS